LCANFAYFVVRLLGTSVAAEPESHIALHGEAGSNARWCHTKSTPARCRTKNSPCGVNGSELPWFRPCHRLTGNNHLVQSSKTVARLATSGLATARPNREISISLREAARPQLIGQVQFSCIGSKLGVPYQRRRNQTLSQFLDKRCNRFLNFQCLPMRFTAPCVSKYRFKLLFTNASSR